VNNRPAVTAQLDQLQLSDTAKTHVYYITADAISNDTVYYADPDLQLQSKPNAS